MFGCTNIHHNSSLITYLEAEKTFQIQSEQYKNKYDEYSSRHGKNINHIYYKGLGCYDKESTFILSIGKDGWVKDGWSDKGSKSTECLLKLSRELYFGVPPIYPYYIKIVMKV